ncbi:MAG: DUF6034 family protein, partial [Clostridiaceae bacterium]
MKRTLCVLFAVLWIIPALAACQKTPESPIVVGKNAEILIEKATATDSAVPVMESADRITGAPQTYQVELANTQGNLLIHVDAEIDVPDVQTLSVARMIPREFTSEDVKKLYDTFCAGATSIGSDPVFTKAFQLRSYQDYLDMRKADVFPDMQYESMEEFDEEIASFMESLESLPDEFTPASADFTFDSRGMASCYAARSNELVSQISVSDA